MKFLDNKINFAIAYDGLSTVSKTRTGEAPIGDPGFTPTFDPQNGGRLSTEFPKRNARRVL